MRSFGEPVALSKVHEVGFDDSRIMLEIEGSRLITESSSKREIAMLAILDNKPGAKLPKIKRVWKTESRETPYVLEIGEEIVFCHPHAWGISSP